MNESKPCPLDCGNWVIKSVTVRSELKAGNGDTIRTTETFKPPLYCPMCGKKMEAQHEWAD